MPIKMKKRVIFLLAVFFTFAIIAQENEGGTIELEITDIESSKGKLMIGLYQDASHWLNKPYKGIIGKIKAGKCIAVFEDIPSGTYAISLFHDENDNDELDMFLGFYPKESTACSNNAPAKFGPPTWEDAKFEVHGKTIKQTIKL